MPKLEYFIVAESVAVDQNTNRLSIFHILDELGLIKDPPPNMRIAVPQVAAVSCWLNEDDDLDKEFQVALRLQMPGEKSAKTIGEITYLADKRRQRILQRFLGFIVPAAEAGELKFQICLNGEPKAHHTVTVSEITFELPAKSDGKPQSNQHSSKSK